MHLSEQPAENEAALAFYGRTPTELLDEAGVLGPLTSAVHATHLTESDVATLGRTGTTSCFCPTTERDLADGIGPARALLDAGSGLSLGSDQHAVIDLIEEARALEMHERLATRRRGRFTPAELLAAATRHDTWAGPTRERWPSGNGPTWWPCGWTARGPPASTRPRSCSPRPPPTSTRWSWTGGPSSRAGSTGLGDVGDLLRKAIEPLWSSTTWSQP